MNTCQKCGMTLVPLVSPTSAESSELYCRYCHKSFPMSQRDWELLKQAKGARK